MTFKKLTVFLLLELYLTIIRLSDTRAKKNSMLVEIDRKVWAGTYMIYENFASEMLIYSKVL